MDDHHAHAQFLLGHLGKGAAGADAHAVHALDALVDDEDGSADVGYAVGDMGHLEGGGFTGVDTAHAALTAGQEIGFSDSAGRTEQVVLAGSEAGHAGKPAADHDSAGHDL